MWQEDRALVALSRAECVALLGTQEVGRVVFTERALPAVVPVSYALFEGTIVIATLSGSRLALAALGSVLAFEVDSLDPQTRTGWSVVVTCLPHYVDELVEQARVLGVLATWAPGRHDLILQLPLTVVSGRRIEADPAACETDPAGGKRLDRIDL